MYHIVRQFKNASTRQLNPTTAKKLSLCKFNYLLSASVQRFYHYINLRLWMSYKREFVVGNSNTFVYLTIKTNRTEKRTFEFIPCTNKVYSNRRRINIFEVINDRRIQSFLCRCENTPHAFGSYKKSLNERPEKRYIKKNYIFIQI